MTQTIEAPPTGGRQLRWLADGYEQAQRVRIRCGEQIRAVLQGRDETWGTEPDPVVMEWDEDAQKAYFDTQLKEIGNGGHTGPVPILGRTYHRHYLEERELQKEMEATLESHPAWPWLLEVRGIGKTLACKILARLDPHQAPHASSFWSYCGLATVPGVRYRCEECGLVRAWPVGFKVTGNHVALGKAGGKCKGSLVEVAGPGDGVRAAQPKASRGEKATYDRYAKKIMYLIGTAFLKAGGPYERHYRKARERLDAERPGWTPGRKNYTALRIVEKLFLSHLWQVWRAEIGLPIGEPYAMAEMGHTGTIEPWSMVGK